MALVEQVMKVLRTADPDIQIAGHSVDVTIHGSLGGQSELDSCIGTYVTRRPDGEPALVPSGVSFQSEFQSDQGQGSIILERSAVVRDGALLRVMSQHVGSLSENEAVSQAIDFFQVSTSRLGLDVLWRS